MLISEPQTDKQIADAYENAVFRAASFKVSPAFRVATDKFGNSVNVFRDLPHMVVKAIKNAQRRQKAGRWYSGKPASKES